MLPGFSALASSTHASCAAPATDSALRRNPVARSELRRGARLIPICAIVFAGSQLAQDRFLRPSRTVRAPVDRRGGEKAMASSLMVGEALVGDGNEVAHIDLLIGPKDG